jgi:hypothetical protein
MLEDSVNVPASSSTTWSLPQAAMASLIAAAVPL